MHNQKAIRYFGVEVPDSLAGSLTEFGLDLAKLVELQLELAKLDLKESTRHALVPFALLVAGLLVLVSTVPIALVGLAELLVAAEVLSRGWAYLLVAIASALIAGGVIWLCARKLAQSFETFERSKGELERNVAWVVKVISEGGSRKLLREQNKMWPPMLSRFERW